MKSTEHRSVLETYKRRMTVVSKSTKHSASSRGEVEIKSNLDLRCPRYENINHGRIASVPHSATSLDIDVRERRPERSSMHPEGAEIANNGRLASVICSAASMVIDSRDH